MAIAFVNGTATSIPDLAGTIAAAAQNHTTGNAIIVFVAQYTAGAPSVSGVADTAGNTYVKAGSTYAVDASGTSECWVALDVTGNANNVVTATYSASAGYRGISVAQYSGIAATSAYDSESTGAITASGSTHTTGSLTTAGADEIVLGYFVYWEGTGGGTLSSSGSSTLRVNDGYEQAISERVAATAGSYSAAVDYSLTGSYTAVAKSFKAAAGGGGGVSGPIRSNYYRMLRGA